MRAQLQKPNYGSSFSRLQNSSIINNSLIRHGTPALISILPRHPPHVLTKHNKKNESSMVVRADFRPSTSVSNITTASSIDRKNELLYMIKAVVTVEVANTEDRLIYDLDEFFKSGIRLEFLSTDLDPHTGLEKERVKGLLQRKGQEGNEIIYESDFTIPAGFGKVGAVEVENENHREMFFKTIVLQGYPDGPLNVPCNSWVHSKFDNPQKRIFFTNKSYLPSKTPSGLKGIRELELQNLRGTGEGVRKKSDRVYDYDKYNDLGEPDEDSDLFRPVLGGQQYPYPRRCRTGRQRISEREERSSDVYIPRDEEFSEVKHVTLAPESVRSIALALFKTAPEDPDEEFPNFKTIDALFNIEGLTLPGQENLGDLQLAIPRVVRNLSLTQGNRLLLETPEMFERDKFSWLRDEEFSRQTLAGLNPMGIELVKEWPLKSKLDPEIYGPPESLLTKEVVEKEIRGFMAKLDPLEPFTLKLEEALEKKLLFVLDYHDLLMPYVNKVRELEGTTLYGSRTLFFLTKEGTLTPLAIELTRPPVDDKPQWKQVFTPAQDATGCWLWRLAKAHVCAHDAGYHQLVIHWLRTHCCTEPYIIAANRQLSAMHPIYRLLHPHFRYNMKMNALARQTLINAGGLIETCFSPGIYSAEISSVAYDLLWRFDMEALPADLIRRGMAVEDPTAEHGLKLAIKDYPFANDGLVLWDAIKEWVSDYVNHYYPDPRHVKSDKELQGWWTEVRTKGHADKKDEPWWPVLDTPKSLIHVLTTIIWVAAGHHAAVNFGQYMYSAYFPNRPSITRTNMPTEDATVDEEFLKKPEEALLKCFPSQLQALQVMVMLDLLSNHSPDEEYIGQSLDSSWNDNPVIKAAHERFSGNLKRLEEKIDERNKDSKLKNRVGAGVVPYELLKPLSAPGVTGMGVPNSISI